MVTPEGDHFMDVHEVITLSRYGVRSSATAPQPGVGSGAVDTS
jgi:hypothetical protein